MFYMITNCK